MQYRWETFALDREGVLLTRDGQQVDVSRKVLACITHLIEQRERVVDFSELMRKVWGHDNVTNHQLAQVILAARRALGDDGNTQRLISTVPGRGYRWVGHLIEETSVAAPLQPAIDTSPLRPAEVAEAFVPSPMDVSTGVRHRGRTLPWLVVCGLVLIAAASVIGLRTRDGQPVATSAKPADTVAPDPLTQLEDKLWQGDAQAVREGLAILPVALAHSPDGRILEIKLEIAGGRLERAEEKIAVELEKSKAAADTIWQARLLILLCTVKEKTGESGPDGLALAQKTLALIESSRQPVPQRVIGEALTAKGIGLLAARDYEAAAQELIRAADILEKTGDQRLMIRPRRMLTFALQRTWRFADALEEIERLLLVCKGVKDLECELLSSHAATRIEMTLLRWDDALARSRRSLAMAKKYPDAVWADYTLALHAEVLTRTGHLRQARSLFEALEGSHEEASPCLTPYLLASGNAEQALMDSAAMYKVMGSSASANLLLFNRGGVLLLWMMAAEDLVAQGRPMPTPSAEQLASLESPDNIPGRIARGRWLMYRGKRQEAEAEFRQALDESKQTNQYFYMPLAAEPLVDLLLEQNDWKAADAMLMQLRGVNAINVDKDFDVSLLRLRVAIAKDNPTEIRDTYRRASALAGERTMPDIPSPWRDLVQDERSAGR